MVSDFCPRTIALRLSNGSIAVSLGIAQKFLGDLVLRMQAEHMFNVCDRLIIIPLCR